MLRQLDYKIKKLGDLVNCKFCNKSFSKASTLAVHLCEPARRHRQRGDTGVQIGYQFWIKFLERNTTKKEFSYEEFSSSPYYSAFVKFGQYLIGIRCINVEEFGNYILGSKIKIDHWTKEQHYAAWLPAHVKREPADRAVERSIETMTRWADEQGAVFNEYFSRRGANHIVQDVVNGRISPWVIYQSQSGKDFLTRVNQEQLALLFEFIDPAWWTSRFSNLKEDVDFVQMICNNSSL